MWRLIDTEEISKAETVAKLRQVIDYIENDTPFEVETDPQMGLFFDVRRVPRERLDCFGNVWDSAEEAQIA
jgi:hypothetical protein